jgi:hypothetical protein
MLTGVLPAGSSSSRHGPGVLSSQVQPVAGSAGSSGVVRPPGPGGMGAPGGVMPGQGPQGLPTLPAWGPGVDPTAGAAGQMAPPGADAATGPVPPSALDRYLLQQLAMAAPQELKQEGEAGAGGQVALPGPPGGSLSDLCLPSLPASGVLSDLLPPIPDLVATSSGPAAGGGSGLLQPAAAAAGSSGGNADEELQGDAWQAEAPPQGSPPGSPREVRGLLSSSRDHMLSTALPLTDHCICRVVTCAALSGEQWHCPLVLPVDHMLCCHVAASSHSARHRLTCAACCIPAVSSAEQARAAHATTCRQQRLTPAP